MKKSLTFLLAAVCFVTMALPLNALSLYNGQVDYTDASGHVWIYYGQYDDVPDENGKVRSIQAETFLYDDVWIYSPWAKTDPSQCTICGYLGGRRNHQSTRHHQKLQGVHVVRSLRCMAGR